ncbi:chaplin [Streptomyces sp. RGM 3693]|uniref:chaplin n=1 Tax=Streptomyces sp. RGM 3693 TaxID=3413284 RepID=UPI003D28180F
MKRFAKTAAVAAVTSALVLGGAGLASADGGHHGRQGRHHGRFDEGHRHHGHTGAKAVGFAAHSPGVLSGNVIQVPINIPINVCGNSLDLLALLNPAFGNICINK